MHNHKWSYKSGVNRTGTFRCAGCRAVVALDVIPNGPGFGFAFRVLLGGAGVSASHLEYLGNWCARRVGQPVAVHLKLSPVRHRRVA